MENTENLREQVMINQFEMATGCSRDQSKQLLQASKWEYATALSMFFQDGLVGPVGYQTHHRNFITGQISPACAPCNTPATPPNFCEALMNMQKLQTSDFSLQQAAPPAPPIFSAPPPPPLFFYQQQQQSPRVLAPYNPMPISSDRYQQGLDCDQENSASLVNAMAPPRSGNAAAVGLGSGVADQSAAAPTSFHHNNLHSQPSHAPPMLFGVLQ